MSKLFRIILFVLIPICIAQQNTDALAQALLDDNDDVRQRAKLLLKKQWKVDEKIFIDIEEIRSYITYKKNHLQIMSTFRSLKSAGKKARIAKPALQKFIRESRFLSQYAFEALVVIEPDESLLPLIVEAHSKNKISTRNVYSILNSLDKSVIADHKFFKALIEHEGKCYKLYDFELYQLLDPKIISQPFHFALLAKKHSLYVRRALSRRSGAMINLLKSMSNPDPVVSKELNTVLVAFGPKLLPFLESTLGDRNIHARKQTLIILQKINYADKHSAAIITDTLQDKAPEVRELALVVLHSLPVEQATLQAWQFAVKTGVLGDNRESLMGRILTLNVDERDTIYDNPVVRDYIARFMTSNYELLETMARRKLKKRYTAMGVLLQFANNETNGVAQTLNNEDLFSLLHHHNPIVVKNTKRALAHCGWQITARLLKNDRISPTVRTTIINNLDLSWQNNTRYKQQAINFLIQKQQQLTAHMGKITLPPYLTRHDHLILRRILHKQQKILQGANSIMLQSQSWQQCQKTIIRNIKRRNLPQAITEQHALVKILRQLSTHFQFATLPKQQMEEWQQQMEKATSANKITNDSPKALRNFFGELVTINNSHNLVSRALKTHALFPQKEDLKHVLLPQAYQSLATKIIASYPQQRDTSILSIFGNVNSENIEVIKLTTEDLNNGTIPFSTYKVPELFQPQTVFYAVYVKKSDDTNVYSLFYHTGKHWIYLGW